MNAWLRGSRRHLIAVILIVLVAALFRAWLIASDGVSFDSDEAVVGLMARHITQGHSIPTFFYGQAYMGSLDALLVAGGFLVFGESVHTIRVVQMILYLLALVTGYGLAYEITRSRRVAGMTLLILAIPTALGALYTTITLGGYNEIVVLSNLVLWMGWQVTVGGRSTEMRDLWRWGVLGLAAGAGWWSNGAIVTPCLVVGVLGLRTFSHRRWRGYALAAAAFLVGSAPWWLYNLQHNWAALKFLTDGFEPAPGTEPISPGDVLIGLLILGLPAITGLRYTWEAGFIVTPGAGLVLGLYIILVAIQLTEGLAGLRARAQNRPPPRTAPFPQAIGWVWLVSGVFVVTFTFSSFSDATGRYLMPLWVPVALGVALGLDRLRRAGWAATALALGLLLAFQAGSVIRAAQSQTGLQPQLVERLQTPPEYDDLLLDFLAEQDYTRGYAAYWTSFRLVFRAHEAVILDTVLPYDENGYNPKDNRYPPYSELVAGAERVVWIAQNFPELDALIVQRLAARSITYKTRDFGPYCVYYAFSARIAPADVGLDSTRPLDELAGWGDDP